LKLSGWPPSCAKAWYEAPQLWLMWIHPVLQPLFTHISPTSPAPATYANSQYAFPCSANLSSRTAPCARLVNKNGVVRHQPKRQITCRMNGCNDFHCIALNLPLAGMATLAREMKSANTTVDGDAIAVWFVFARGALRSSSAGYMWRSFDPIREVAANDWRRSRCSRL
jgi:hypothetical protein